MTCNNCIHNDLCNERERSNGKFPVRPCDHFKDKYLFVELPCKVGDTVYQVDCERIYELEIFDVSLRKNKPYYETESIDFDNDAIGKTVFLTKEEAEAKLKEMEK